MSTEDIREFLGQENIQSYFSKEIRKTWSRLAKKYSNKKGKILFTFFVMLTKLSHSLKDEDSIDPQVFLKVPIFLETLDEFLQHGWNVLEQVTPAEIQRYVNVVAQEFLLLGYMRNRAIESKIYNEEKLITKKGVSAHTIPLISDSILESWIGNFLLDGDWYDYYYSQTKKSEELKAELSGKFLEEYGFTPEQLFWAEIGFDKTAKNQYDQGGNLPLPYMSEKLLPTLMDIMKKYGPIEENAVKRLLTELEYTPEKHWARSPLVDVRIGNKRRYIPILPSMFIHGSISLAWLESFKKSRKGASLQGMINKDWGSHFEEYVRDILRKHHDNLQVNPGCMKIKKKQFPEIITCTRNPQPEIDVVARSETNVYLISCKAMDESTSSKILLYFYLHDYSSFRNNIELDMKYAGQIGDIAECVRNSPSFIEVHGFMGKKIIPLLVTSDYRPLSLESVRQWSLDMKLIHEIPETRIIQARELRNIMLE